MNLPSNYSKFQTVANIVMHVDTVVFRGEAVLMIPEAIRPEMLLVDEKMLIISS